MGGLYQETLLEREEPATLSMGKFVFAPSLQWGMSLEEEYREQRSYIFLKLSGDVQTRSCNIHIIFI